MGKPNWTESEMAYLTQHYEKTDNKTIGIALGRSPASISAKGISMGLVKCMLTVNKNRSESGKAAAKSRIYHTENTDKWCDMGLMFVSSLAGHPSFEAGGAQAGFISSIHCLERGRHEINVYALCRFLRRGHSPNRILPPSGGSS